LKALLENMKKLVIGLTVFGVFVLYSLGIRDKSPVLTKPSLGTNPPSSAQITATSNTSSAGSAPPVNNSANSTGQLYKDGTYTGSVADAYYGNVQVSTTISGGKITDVRFLQSPDTHSTSVIINQQAMPYLKQEAIKSQTSNVQIISGATYTSQAFIQSLATALSSAQA
jgi:uncharacterized protein with FMN-binding domain